MSNCMDNLRWQSMQHSLQQQITTHMQTWSYFVWFSQHNKQKIIVQSRYTTRMSTWTAIVHEIISYKATVDMIHYHNRKMFHKTSNYITLCRRKLNWKDQMWDVKQNSN